jgi:hypothetical protein
MPSPVPGMNPYLEAPQSWSGVHNWLVTEMAKVLGTVLPANYYVAVEERVYEVLEAQTTLIGVPDNAVFTTSGPANPAIAIAPLPRLTEPTRVTLPMPTEVNEALFPIPLQPQDPEIPIDLKPLLDLIYDLGRFHLRIDYRPPPPEPQLTEVQMQWCGAIAGQLA